MQRIESNIFRTITDAEWSAMSQSGCLRLKTYDKNTIILHMGDTTTEIGIVASGNVNIENIDILGNKTILSNVAAGHVFAETYAFCNEPLMVDAVAGEDSQILFLNLEMMRQSYNNSSWYAKIMKNMLAISMQKNMILSNRIFCTSPKTIRGRLLVYLSAQSRKSASKTFQIPFDRQQLADYLNTDRSALSAELGKMKKEGILDFHKNSFKLL